MSAFGNQNTAMKRAKADARVHYGECATCVNTLNNCSALPDDLGRYIARYNKLQCRHRCRPPHCHVWLEDPERRKRHEDTTHKGCTHFCEYHPDYQQPTEHSSTETQISTSARLPPSATPDEHKESLLDGLDTVMARADAVVSTSSSVAQAADHNIPTGNPQHKRSRYEDAESWDHASPPQHNSHRRSDPAHDRWSPSHRPAAAANERQHHLDEIERLEMLLRQSQNERARIWDQYRTLEIKYDNDQFKRRFDENVSQRLVDKNRECNQLTAKCSDLEAENEQLTAEVTELRTSNQALDSKADEYTTAIAELNSRYNQLQEDAEQQLRELQQQAAAERQQLEAAVNELKAELGVQHQQVDSSTVGLLTEQVKKLQRERNRAVHSQQTTQQQYEQLFTDNTALNKLISQLKKKHQADLNQLNNKHQSELREMSKAKTDAVRSAQTARAQVTDLRKQLSEMTKQKSDMQARVEQLEFDNDEQLNTLQSQLSKLQVQLQSPVLDSAAAHTTAKSDLQQLTHLQNSVAALEASLKKAHQENKSLKTQHKEAYDKISRENRQLNKALASANKERDGLHSQLQTALEYGTSEQELRQQAEKLQKAAEEAKVDAENTRDELSREFATFKRQQAHNTMAAQEVNGVPVDEAGDGKKCIICYDMDREYVMTGCGHMLFCAGCALGHHSQWLKTPGQCSFCDQASLMHKVFW